MLSMSQQELSYYSFNDKRLVKRFSSIMEQLLSAAAKSFPAIFTDKAALKGFYRFISNQEVTETGLLAAHSCYTAKQVEEKNSRRVYLLQDTTSLDTNRYAKQGVGYLHKQHSKGLWLHHSLLLDEQFMPLGLLESQTIIRERADYGKKYSRKQTKLEEKESYKWIAGIQRATCLQAMEVVHVADRESDMAAFMQAILDDKQQFVIRSAQNRRLSGEQVKLREKLQASPQIGLVRQLTNKQGKCYQATCSLSYAQVSLANKQAAIVLQAVYLREQAGDTEWLLLTNLPVSNCAQAIAIFDIYQQRWLVEEYHKCLKQAVCLSKGRPMRRIISIA